VPWRFEIDYQFVLGRCLHRQVGWFRALEDAIDVAGCKTVLVGKTRPIRNQSSSSSIGALLVGGRQLMLEP
jgi:hypothetical protein